MLALEHKKDPGIPNLCPFKEKVLREVENRKQKVLYVTMICYNDMLLSNWEVNC